MPPTDDLRANAPLPHAPRVTVPTVTAAALWMALAQLFFAVMNVTAHFGSADVPWQEVAATRFLVGAAVSLAIARSRGKSLRGTRPRLKWMRAAFGTLSAIGTFYVLGSSRIALGDAVTLVSTMPIFIALLSWPVLGERVTASVGAAVLASFVGILVVVRPTLHAAGIDVAAALAGALFGSLAMITIRRIGTGESSEAVVFHFSAVATVVFIALSIPVFTVPSSRAAFFLAMTGLMGGLAQVAMTRAYSLGGAARVSVVSYLGLVFTRILAIPLFGERPDAFQIGGSLLVIASGVALSIAPKRASHAADPLPQESVPAPSQR